MRGSFRTIGRLAAACVLAVLMTGCIKLDMNLTLKPNDTVDGTVVFALNKQLLQATGKSFGDLTGGTSAVPSGVPVQTSDYDDGTFQGKRYTFSGVPLDRFNGNSQDGSLTITHQGDTFVVDGTLDLSSATSTLPGADQALSSAQISVEITFPGAVSSASPGGVIDGKTVTWTPKLGQKTEIQATGSAIASGGTGPWLWIAIAAVVLALVIGLLIVVSRRNRPAAAPVSDEAAAEPVADAETSAAAGPAPPMPAAPEASTEAAAASTPEPEPDHPAETLATPDEPEPGSEPEPPPATG